MAGTWARSGTIALTSGSKKVTGTGTAWNSGLNKVTKGCALKHNNIDYEVDYVNSDTELYLVDTYNGATLSGQAYRIQVAVTDTIPELSSRIAQALAYWNGQGANLQLMMSGSGNVTLTFPDGTQVTIPAWGNMQPKDGLLTAIAALTTSADKLFYATGTDAVAMTTLSAKGRELIDDADSSAMLTTLGVSTFIKSLLDDTDAAAALGTLGITKASLAETNSRLATDRVVTPAGLNAVVPYAPTINPTLDLDFAKQKYRWYAGAAGLTESSTPSLMTFTRSSVATYFDAMGVMRQAANDIPRIDYDPATGECKGLLIEESRTNLFNYSSRFDNAVWSKSNCILQPNSALAPDGTLTAATVSNALNANSYLGQIQSITASTWYTKSIYVKPLSSNQLFVFTVTNVGAESNTKFDLATLTITGTNAATSQITQANNGYYRLSMSWLSGASGDNAGSFYLGAYGASATLAQFNIWGAQLEVGAFPTTYIPSTDIWTARASTATYLDANGVVQTAASGVARSNAYDYDSDGVLRPVGLLLEASATNQLLYSEQFDNAIWGKSESTITANATTAPDGSSTADKLTESANTVTHYVAQTISASASTTYTFSCYFKPAGRNNARVTLNDGTTEFNAYFDLVGGVVLSNPSGTTAAIKKAANGFFRCSFTVTTGASAAGLGSYIYPANSTPVATYPGDGASGIYLWGAQLAAGNYATSYIPTTTAQVTRVADTSTSAQATRAADNAVISGINFSQWYKQYEGTVTCEFDINALGGLAWPGVFSIYSDSLNRIGGLVRDYDTDAIGFVIKKSGSTVMEQTSSAPVVTKAKQKIGFSFSNSSVGLGEMNGVATSGSNAAGLPISPTNLAIGKHDDRLNGHIRSLKYFPKTLASAELQAITA